MTLYRIMVDYSHDDQHAKTTRHLHLWRDNIPSRELALAEAEHYNAAKMKLPRHPASVKPGEPLFHEPHRFTVEEYEA